MSSFVVTLKRINRAAIVTQRHSRSSVCFVSSTSRPAEVSRDCMDSSSFVPATTFACLTRPEQCFLATTCLRASRAAAARQSVRSQATSRRMHAAQDLASDASKQHKQRKLSSRHSSCSSKSEATWSVTCVHYTVLPVSGHIERERIFEPIQSASPHPRSCHRRVVVVAALLRCCERLETDRRTDDRSSSSAAALAKPAASNQQQRALELEREHLQRQRPQQRSIAQDKLSHKTSAPTRARRDRLASAFWTSFDANALGTRNSELVALRAQHDLRLELSIARRQRVTDCVKAPSTQRAATASQQRQRARTGACSAYQR